MIQAYWEQILWGFVGGAIAVSVLSFAIFFMFKIQGMEKRSSLFRGALYLLCVVLIIAQFYGVFLLSKSVEMLTIPQTAAFALSFIFSLTIVGLGNAFLYQKLMD